MFERDREEWQILGEGGVGWILLEITLGGEWVKGPGKQRRGEREGEDGAHGTPLNDLESIWVGWQSPALEVCPRW